MLINKYPYDLIRVSWDDAGVSSGWESETTVKITPEPVETVGYLIRKTKKHVLVGASIFYNEEDKEYSFNNRMQIPKGMVHEIEILIPKNTTTT